MFAQLHAHDPYDRSIMDEADEQTRKQRELRRKRIIENAKNRMEKLKRLQQRTYVGVLVVPDSK